MKIAHINNIAGVPWRLAEAQRRLGHEAVVFSLQESPYHFTSDVQLRGTDGPLGWNAVMLAHWRTYEGFDVLHVHGGMWKSQVFYPLFKRFRGKTLVVHFHGSETRTGKGLHHLEFADLQFHSTPDLARWLPHSTWVANPIDLPPAPPEPDNRPPRFGHFVSSSIHKGTERVVDLFREAFGPVETEVQGNVTKLRGKDAELWVVSQVPHASALDIMKTCDAVIDQISSYGIYGMVAIEAMAYGKPVLGTPRLGWFPGCPIVTLTSDGAEDSLRKVGSDSGFRRRLGEAGRAYVAKVHESGKVAAQVLKAYYAAQQLPALNADEAVSYWRRRGVSYAAELSSPKVRSRYDEQAAELLGILERLPFESVGEIGCGFGRIGREIVRRRRKSWVGADISRDQLLEARRRSDVLRGWVVEASADSLPFANEAFDLAMSVEMLMHIPPGKIGSVLSELWRVARRHVVHLDWFEDYLVGHQTGWCWVHDYPNLWKSLGGSPEEIRLRSTGIQRVFVVTKSE